MERVTPQSRRLAVIGQAAATVLRRTEYHRARAQDIAAEVRLDDGADRRSSGGRRSAVWLYNEVRSRRVLVALAARHAWEQHLEGNGAKPPGAEPRTVSEAIDALAAALLSVGRFQRIERFLTTQVALGLGDIATSEKRTAAEELPAPAWPDSTWGRVAAEGYAGRCAVFADHLAPVLSAAAACATPLPADEAWRQAARLSDLVFRGLIGDPDGPVERMAEGFAAYWFERELVPAAGRWVRELRAAELGLDSIRRRSGPARSEAAAHGEIVRVLMNADTLHPRAARAAESWYDGLLTLVDGTGQDANAPYPDTIDAAERPPTELLLSKPIASHASSADLKMLCDAASRHGLATHRYGDHESAAHSYQVSRDIAEQSIRGFDADEAASYAARCDHNLAQAALDRADFAAALELCEAAYRTRLRSHEAFPDSAAVTRRYSLTAALKIQLDAALGRPVAAVSAADLAVSRNLDAAEGITDARVARARSVLGEALLAAAHPVEAGHHLEAARQFRQSAYGAVNRTIHRNNLLLAQRAIDRGTPERAELLLPPDDVLDWCADRISYRFAADARRLRAKALAATGELGAAEALIEQTLSDYLRHKRTGVADLMVVELYLARAETLWLAQHPKEARDAAGAALASLDVAATRSARFTPWHATAMLWLGRCADALGERQAARTHYAKLIRSAADVLERTCPVLLAADLDQARRLLDARRPGEADRLIRTLIDRRPLGHSRPAVEAGHPLYAEAMALAETMGIATDVEQSHDWDDE